MPISFSCGQCGKDYLVSDGLAGKKAVCKACNNRMMIPGAPAPSPATQRTTSPRAANGSAPATRPVSSRPSTAPTARPAPVARVPEPADDIYGLDEAPAPLPPMMPRSAGVAESAAAEAPVKKKKKKGFFSSGKKSSAKSFQYSGVGAGPIRLIAIVVGVIAAAVGGFGLVGRSDVRAFHQRTLDMKQEMLTILQGVRDVPSAQAASPRLQGLLDRMYKHIDDNRKKKARKTDINAVVAEMQARNNALDQQLMTEFSRVGGIPGAGLALNIEGQINRLAALEQQVKQESGNDGPN